MNILGMIMAGGEGSRLHPLTQDRAKPAVQFGGKYRLIDFVLSNFINSKIFSIYVLTQFKSQSLSEHIQAGWQFGSILKDHFIQPVPAQKRTGGDWYQGTADAIFQNINLIQDRKYDLVAIFGADHVYRMDIQDMVRFHLESKADVTVSAVPVPLDEAKQFGIIRVDSHSRIIGFMEKPKKPKSIPGRPNLAFASMGNYIFNANFLTKVLFSDARKSDSSHDFGKDILPSLYKDHKVFAYDFSSNRVPGMTKEEVAYWRDVGTISSFWEANMDLRNVEPVFNLYNRRWPIRTASSGLPPAKFVLNQDGRRGNALDSLVSEGCIISGGTVEDSVLGREVRVHDGALVSNALLMDRVQIGANCKVHRAIIDKNVSVPPGTSIGYDLAEDKKRFHVDPESNIIVIPKNFKFD